MPKDRNDYWTAKLGRNVERDRQNLLTLEAMGWEVLVVWECETRDLDRLRQKLCRVTHEMQSERH